MKLYPLVDRSTENNSKKLHRKMNNQVGPTKLVPIDMYLLVDTDELQKQVNDLQTNLEKTKRCLAKSTWTGSRRRRAWR